MLQSFAHPVGTLLGYVSDFSTAWNISRGRFVDTIADLSDAQLNWKIHSQALSIGQMALHVAGVEVLFASQLLDLELNPQAAELKSAATDGVVNDKPFPFRVDRITAAEVAEGLQSSKQMLEPIITSPSQELLTKEIVSALGPVITGEGALGRLAFHSAYHQGQAYLIRTAPGFPQGAN